MAPLAKKVPNSCYSCYPLSAYTNVMAAGFSLLLCFGPYFYIDHKMKAWFAIINIT